MRLRKIIATKCVATASPIGEERYKPGYGKYGSITTVEKTQYQITVAEAAKNEKLNKRLDNSWERLLRKVSESRASERIF